MKNSAMLPLSLLSAIGFVSALALPSPAANVLVNGGFEDPVVGGVGNNFPATLPNWTLVPSGAPCNQGHNVILAGAGYDGGPDVAAEGNQYYDICGAAGYIWQSFTINAPSTVNFGASFSRRDADTGGGSTAIFDGTNNTLLFSSPDAIVDASESQEIWRVSTGIIPSLPAGTYVMRVNIMDPANADAVFVDVSPVPEPGSALLVLAGAATALRRRRK